MTRLVRRVWFLLHQRRLEREMQEEMQAHREMMAGGEQARFGNMLLLREQCRDEWGWRWIDAMRRDALYAFRMMRKAPAFSAAVILVLALGIGLNTALFSLAYPLFIRPLPFPGANRLYSAAYVFPKDNRELVWMPDLRFWQRSASSFDSIAGISWESLDRITDENESVPVAAVSANFFRLLGVKPALGRDFRDEEDRPDAAAFLDSVIVVSHQFWRDELGADPAAIGRKVSFKRGEALTFTVIGVMPADFLFPEVEKLAGWILLEPRTAFGRQYRAGIPMPDVIARLKKGVSPKAAQAEMDHLAQQRLREEPMQYRGASIRLARLDEKLVAQVRSLVLLLTGIVGLLLLLTCTNVAGMMMSRVASRMQEIAVRGALGAGRRTIAAQLLTEALVLSGCGSAVGLLVAQWSMDLFIRFSPVAIPRRHELGIDVSTLICAVVLAALTAIVCGACPVLWLTGRKSGVRKWLACRRMASGTRAERRTIGSLVAVQSAISVALLLGTGLLIRTMVKLSEVDPGFRPDGVVTVRLLPPQSKRTTQFPAFAMEAIRKVEAMPTVSAVGGISHFPIITRGWWMDDIVAQDLPEPPPGSELRVELRLVTPDYFRALGISRLAGRPFTWHDDAKAQRVVILSKSLAHQLWPGADPLGKRVRSTVDDKLWATVVGVVGDVRDFGLDTRPRLLLYRPIGQGGWPNTALFIKSSGDPGELQRRIRAELPAVAAGTRIRNLQTVSEALQKSLAPRRFNMVLLASFAAFAWLLSFVGTYGMVAYSVASRTREIGIRMALGARSWQIQRSVIRAAVVPVACGIVIGVPAALALAHSVRSFLFGVQTADAPAISISSALLLLSAALAAFVPGRRAARIDPGVTLRTE